jgi:hypothetical protein
MPPTLRGRRPDLAAERFAAPRATWRELMHGIRTIIIGAAAATALMTSAVASAAVFTPSQTGPLTPNSYAGLVDAYPEYWQLGASGPEGYARMVYRPAPPWSAGETHSFAGRFLLSSESGYVSLLRADNYAAHGHDGYVFGVARYTGDHLGHLVVGTYSGDDQEIGPPFAIPIGSWFDIKVTITVGSSIAVSMDGIPVASGSYYTAPGKEPITAVRSGVVATGDPGQIEVRQQYFAVDE